MDERHWWIAKRLSQAFSIEPSASALEKFINAAENIEKINNFLAMNGSNKLFAACVNSELAPPTSPFGKQVILADDVTKLPQTVLESLDSAVILYFLRHDTNQEVSVTQIHKEVFCGEIKNISQMLHNVYSDLFLSTFNSNQTWSPSSSVSTMLFADSNVKMQSIRNMEKYVSALNDLSLVHANQKNMLLKRVDPEAFHELKQANRLSPDSPVLKYGEDLSTDWMHTIENILSDICDEKVIHQSVGPNSELERWQRKQRLLLNLTEQLKTKECKSVISALITSKSRVLKRWRVVDTGITDAQNECRDKVKYLESLRRPIDQFYHDATPITCVTTALPNLCNTMRNLESASRYYARQGYLGILFTKVTNQLVNICKEYLLEMAQMVDNEQYFWPIILKEVDELNNPDRLNHEIACLETIRAYYNKYSYQDPNATPVSKTSKSSEFSDQIAKGITNDDTFINRLKSCILVQAKYKEAFRSLRDSLGGSQALNGFQINSVNSFAQNQIGAGDGSSSLSVYKQQQAANKQTAVSNQAVAGRRSSFTNTSETSNTVAAYVTNKNQAGILMSDEETIFGHVDLFCRRVKSVYEQIVSLAQFKSVFRQSNSLSRPKREDYAHGKVINGRFVANKHAGSDNSSSDDESAESGVESDQETTEHKTDTQRTIDSKVTQDTLNESKTNGKLDKVRNKKAEKSMTASESEKEDDDYDLLKTIDEKNSSYIGDVGGGEGEIVHEHHDKSSMAPKQRQQSKQSRQDDPRSQLLSPNQVMIKQAHRLFETEKTIEEDSQNIMNKTKTITMEDLNLIKKYYKKKDAGPTVSSIIETFINQLKKLITSIKALQILDVETKESRVFDELHQSFQKVEHGLERFLVAYISVIFIRNQKTHDGLNILTKFASVSQRAALRQIINDKYVEMFGNYEKDLNEIERVFKSTNENPPLLRNAPPIGGAISWVRQLLKIIEEPMRVFREHKYISSLTDFVNTLKYYNELVEMMLHFENAYLAMWKSGFDQAKHGFKDYLLVKDEDNLTFDVNANEKLMILFQETKWLSRLDIEIPAAARDLCSQETKFKLYKSNLDTLLHDYKNVVQSIPDHLFELFRPHIKQTLDLTNPGCFILTWNSLNIDSFLKTVELGIKKLSDLLELVKDKKEARIFSLIEEINDMYLFDYDMAFSKRWMPEEFVKAIGRSIKDKSEMITSQLASIENEIIEIGQVLAMREGLSNSHPLGSPSNHHSHHKKKKPTLKELLELEPKLNELKKFYVSLLYYAIYNSVCSSLKCLVESCGYELESGGYSLEEEDNLQTNGSDTQRSVVVSNSGSSGMQSQSNDLMQKYMRVKSADLKSLIDNGQQTNNNNNNRPVSVTTAILKAKWTDERKLSRAFLNLEFQLKYTIPDVVTEPVLEMCEKAMKIIAINMIETSKVIPWLNPMENQSFYQSLVDDDNIRALLSVFNSLIIEIGPSIKSHMVHFKLFEFLWKEDLNYLFTEFMKYNPSEYEIRREIERLVQIESQIVDIPDFLNIGPICLNTDSVRVSLKAFAYNWKCKYASVLHQLSRARLEECIVYRENVQKRLSVNVQTLEQLNDALRLLEELADMENKIDQIYLPIENTYNDLMRYELILTRQELEQVTNLRENWSELMKSAEVVRTDLLQEKRNMLEQELDKQVKTFVVEVIRFRNSFDASGPSVVGISPYEAIRRLHDFQKQYDTYDSRRKTLDSISMLFGLQCKPFPELDKTGDELALLNQLYKVYQVFLAFDKTFRNTLWSDVDLTKAHATVHSFWTDFLALPEKLKESWEAYFDLKKELRKYLDVLPMLLLLNEKEIRNRHWMQVMQVTQSAFRLEAAVFKLNDLVDIGLDRHAPAIEEICRSAKKEQELESKMRAIEEEWNEQTLNFVLYKDYGEIIFDKEYTERLLEQLEDGQEQLAQMLTSKHVAPLRNEVANWSEKLKAIGEVLELWLEVQDLWTSMEGVFTNPVTIKEMPAEAKRFARVDKSWIKSQKQSYDMKSVIQCCLGSSVQENAKRALLKDIQKEFEVCFRSLNSYLDRKRRSFPRYYFLSNSALLTLLSHSNSSTVANIRPFFSSLFMAVHDLRLEEIKEEKFNTVSGLSISSRNSHNIPTPTTTGAQGIQQASKANLIPDIQYEIPEVYSIDGDTLQLSKKVNVEKSAETWLPRLKDSMQDSLKRFLSNAISDILNSMPIEELALKYPTQVCLLALGFYWTREVEACIFELRNDRKLGNLGSKKFMQLAAKFMSIIPKSRWVNADKPLLNYHKSRLETMITYTAYLRDTFESIVNKRVKDLNDFEWQKCFRVYIYDENEIPDEPQAIVPVPKLVILDDRCSYGYEFYGNELKCVITPMTERCFLSLWQASRVQKGGLICGRTNVGKTQTAKGLAQMFGRFLNITYCSNQTEPVAIASSLHGLALDGSWGLFDEIQNLSELSLSWFSEYSTSIIQALRKRVGQAQLSDGKEINVNPNFNLLLTMNPFSVSSPNHQHRLIPIQFKSSYRVVALMEPDIEIILRARCIQYGFKAANIVASRLKVLYDLCQTSLMSLRSKYQITITSFLSVLQTISGKTIRADTASLDGSRPNSITAAAGQQSASNTTKFGSTKVELLTTQVLPVKEVAKKNRLALVNYSKSDHGQIGQALLDMITPRLETDDAKTFRKLVQEVLGFKEDPKLSFMNQTSNLIALERLITEKATNDYNLFPNKDWVEKCLQLYIVSTSFKGIVLCGNSATGKTSTLNVLVDALTQMNKESQINSSNNAVFKQTSASNLHKIKKINHLAFDDDAQIFGSLTQNNEFKDGFFTYALRKACRNQSTTWLCFDGPVLPAWCDNFNSIFDSGLFMQLKNGDHVNNMCKLVLETDNISNAAPSLLSKVGIVCYGEEMVGWRSIARSWLEYRTNTEGQCLQKAFAKTMDDVSFYVIKECKPILQVSEEGLFISCLNLLGAMLNENLNVASEIHIERLFIFCLIWTFGSVLDQTDQKGFSDLLYKLVTTLPDDDLKNSVFEYYVDETGEWDNWTQRVPENVYMDSMDLLGNVYVDTVDTIRCRLFLEFCHLAHQNVIIFGPRGCGKSKMLQEFVQEFDANLTITKRLNFSGSTSVTQLQKFIESNIVHRQGFTWGGEAKKQLSVFIDDINTPLAQSGVQRCNEFIRQIIDSKFIYSYNKPFEIKKLEDINFFCTMTYSQGASNRPIDPRLLRHSVLLNLPMPGIQALKTIYTGVLEAALLHNDLPNIDSELSSALVDASLSLLETVGNVLKASPTSGRQHYLFNMKTITTILQGLSRLSEEQRSDNLTIISLWKYEVMCTIADQIPRFSDMYWFESTLSNIVQEKLMSYVQGKPLIESFISFGLENKSFDRPISGLEARHAKISLTPVSSMDKIRHYIDQLYNRFKEEFGYNTISVFMSENAASHIIRIHRILSFSQGGNLILIGTAGNHLTSLIKLAFYLTDVQHLPIDCSKTSNFFDSMRNAVRTAGAENKCVGLVFTSKDLNKGEYFDTINSLINNGECNDLFTNDEMDGLYHAIGPSIKREFPTMLIDPKKFFNYRVRRNLHICLALTPVGSCFQSIIKNYSTMLGNCQVYWIQDWREEHLLCDARHFMSERVHTEGLADKLAHCMSDIHLYMLNECKQIEWAGTGDKDIKIAVTTMSSVPVNTSTNTAVAAPLPALLPGSRSDARTVAARKDFKTSKDSQDAVQMVQQPVTTLVSVPNLPYSNTMLQELIRQKHADKNGDKSKLHTFIGPHTFIRFMYTFWHFYTTKAKQCENDIIRLRKVLGTLSKTRDGARQMKDYIGELREKCKKAEEESDEALRFLIEKTTIVENLKAKLGMGSQLAALMQMQEDSEHGQNDSIASGDHELLGRPDEYDDYDNEFMKMKEESDKNRYARMIEELEKYKNAVEECKRNLAEKKKMVEHWRSRVDKTCIDRIRSFQNPPSLIGYVLELVITMIGGKKKLLNDAESTKDDKASEKPKQIRPPGKLDRVEKAQWKQYQNMMQDSSKFVDLLYGIEWEEGLSTDMTQVVESYLAKGKEDQTGITGEGLLLENPEKTNIPATKSNEPNKGITITAARYASEDVALIVHYVIAILEYSRWCNPLRLAKEKVEALKREYAEFERKRIEKENENHDEKLKPHHEDYKDQDLPRLLRELEELQNKFDAAAVNKHKLHIELESCIQRLEAASLIVESIANLEEQWIKWIQEHSSHEQTITNCIITAAYFCYCGPFDKDTRLRLSKQFADYCLKHDIPREPQQVFRDLSLPEFLFTPIQIREIQLLRLPTTENILENGCFLIEDYSFDNWPLICDPTRRSIDWIRTYYKDKQFFVARQNEMKSTLETCLSEGHYLLISDCDIASIMNNRKLETIVRNKNRFLNSEKPFKLNLGTQEIECNPKFRLFLHTGSEANLVPDYLATYTLVVNFRLVRFDIEEEMLDRFLQLAKPRIDNERYALLYEKVTTMKVIDPLEQDITNFLASDVDLLHNIDSTKQLAELKKSYDEAMDSNIRIASIEEPLIKTRESYREIAKRAAICYDVTQCLKELNPNYALSFKQFVQLFEDSLYQFERFSPQQVIQKLTYSVFRCVSRFMNEYDRRVYSILLAFEIEAESGRLKPGEREYIISPVYGATLSQQLIGKPILTEAKCWSMKKPFDWMSDEQFTNLQYLCASHSWFNDAFDRMPRDGRETQWRSLCESDTPEIYQPLPDKLDELLTPAQRFCVIRAVRPDRIVQIGLAFVAQVLNKEYVATQPLDLDTVLLESNTPQKPIVLMFNEEVETVRHKFQDFAKQMVGAEKYHVLDINSIGQGDDKTFKRTMTKAMEEGSWVLLQNCQNSPSILSRIESTINDPNRTIDARFRCWISINQDDTQPPSSLMINSVRVLIDPTITMKESLVRSFDWIQNENLKCSNKSEWPILLHNICYLHSCLRLRSRFTRCGWNAPELFNFSTEEFLESLQFVTHEYTMAESRSNASSTMINSQQNGQLAAAPAPPVANVENKIILSELNKNYSLQAVKHMLTQIIYGGSALDEFDLLTMDAMGEFWITALTSRKDFELAKLKYKVPSVFYNQPVRLNPLKQSFDANISPFQLEAPEACHLLPSVETVLGDDVYIMSRFCKVIDSLPVSSTNVKLYDRSLTPMDNAVVPLINGSSANPIVSAMSAFSSSSHLASQIKKYNDLNEYATTVLNSKLPRPLTKDQINEKVRKTGGWTPFNMWIADEINKITTLINTVKNHLQIIKSATEVKKIGWELTSDELVEIADSLYNHQIPRVWCLLAGNGTVIKSLNYSLANFISDMSVRFQHMDKCLTVGKEKMPAYNLSAFYRPQMLLSMLKLDMIKNKNLNDDAGCVENIIFQTEMTSRDKEHLRDPPKEGMFIYGLYLWGCHWEKNTGELIDAPAKAKEGYLQLPVIHITAWMESEKPVLNDSSKAPDLYRCPVYANRRERGESLFELDMYHTGIPPLKWSLRGVCTTLKPY